MPVDLKKYTRGICWICNTKCDPDAYCHFECADAYSEENKRRRKEANEKTN